MMTYTFKNNALRSRICDNISYTKTARALCWASLALLAASCGTFRDKDEAPVCDGKQRRPANVHGSILPGAPSPAFVAPPADTRPGQPPELITVQPPAANQKPASQRSRKYRRASPTASLGPTPSASVPVFASC